MRGASAPTARAVCDTGDDHDEFDARKMMQAASAAPPDASAPRQAARSSRRSRCKVAAQPIVAAYSPIVLAGIVRLIEFALIVLVGAARLCSPTSSRSTASTGTTSPRSSASRVLAMLAFQVADIYQVQAFRGHEKQYFRLAVGLVGRLPARHRRDASSPRPAISSRASGSAASTSSACSRCSAFRRALFLLVRRWTREGRLDRRTVDRRRRRPAATALINVARGAARLRRAHRRRVRRPRRRPLADASVAGYPKLGTVDDLVEFARRTRIDLVIFSLPISAESRILQMLKKLWVLPVDIRLVGAHQQAALPPARLFLHRHRAGARRVRQADHRLGRRDEMAVRQDRRRPRC